MLPIFDRFSSFSGLSNRGGRGVLWRISPPHRRGFVPFPTRCTMATVHYFEFNTPFLFHPSLLEACKSGFITHPFNKSFSLYQLFIFVHALGLCLSQCHPSADDYVSCYRVSLTVGFFGVVRVHQGGARLHAGRCALQLGY